MFESLEDIEIKILPKEGPIRVMNVQMAKMALTLKDMIESTGQPITKDTNPVPLTNISGKILDKIIEYLKYHFDDPIEDRDSDEEDNTETKRSDDMTEWDRKFMQDMDCETLFDLILAANYLHIKGLLDLGCKIAANQIKGKTAEEVRNLWNIECDLSSEEVEQLKQDNAWAEDN